MSSESFSEKFDKSKEFLKLAGILIEEQDTVRLSNHFLDYFFSAWSINNNVHSAIFSALLTLIEGEVEEEKLVSYYAIVKILLIKNLEKHPEDLNAQELLLMLKNSPQKRPTDF